MSQLWIEKLRGAKTQVEFDEILLRDFNEMRKEYRTNIKERIRDDVEDQIRALAALAFTE